MVQYAFMLPHSVSIQLTIVVLYDETPLVQRSADFSDDGKTIITEVLHWFRPVLIKQLNEVKA